MQQTPRRLRRLSAARPISAPGGIVRHNELLVVDARISSAINNFRAGLRAVAIVLWTAVAVPCQAMLILLPGRPKILFARIYWWVFCRLMAARIRVIGAPAYRAGRRPVIFASTHSSWLDVPVLGAVLEACFISKDDIADWPLVSTVARLGRTVFVSRQRISTGRERDAIHQRLADGDSLVLFPEGTTSDGSRVLPFRSSFFAVADDSEAPLVQPVSVVYDQLEGLPTGRANRALFAWYGDMEIFPHFWRLAQQRRLRVTVLLHEPLDPAAFPDRKALALAGWAAAAEGAAALRQNRAARPLAAPAPSPPPMEWRNRAHGEDRHHHYGIC